MGVDQIAKHDHSSDADGGDAIAPNDLHIGGNNFVAQTETFPLLSFDLLSNEAVAISATSWTTLDGATAAPFVDFSQLPDGTYEGYIVAQMKNDTAGEDTNIRLKIGGTASPAATVTGTSFGQATTPPTTYGASGIVAVNPQGQVTAGNATYRRLTAHLGMKL